MKAGSFTISGDVAAKFPTLGFGAHIRKAWGYVFSTRLEYMYGTGKGQNWLPSTNYELNEAWAEQWLHWPKSILQLQVNCSRSGFRRYFYF